MLVVATAGAQEDGKSETKPPAGDTAQVETKPALAQAEPAKPVAEQAPEDEAKPRQTPSLGETLVQTAQGEFWRIETIKEPDERAAASRVLLERIGSLISRPATRDAEIAWDLATLQQRLHLYLGDAPAARQIAEKQHADFLKSRGGSVYTEWVEQRTRRLINLGEYDLAIMHLQLQIGDSLSADAAICDLLIGDVLTSKGAPDGSFSSALEHYQTVADRFRSTAPDIADDALFRRAKLLWRDGQIEAATVLFKKLAEDANDRVAELARHYPSILKDADDLRG